MANTKPLASQVKYGSGNNTVDKTLKKAILSFPTLVEAQAAAATLPDGQVVEAHNAEGRLSRFDVQSGALVFSEFVKTELSGSDLSAVSSWTNVPEVLDSPTSQQTKSLLLSPTKGSPLQLSLIWLREIGLCNLSISAMCLSKTERNLILWVRVNWRSIGTHNHRAKSKWSVVCGILHRRHWYCGGYY